MANVIDADGTLRPLLHFASFMVPPGWLSAAHTPPQPLSHHVEYSLRIMTGAPGHVMLKYSQPNKPSQDGRHVPVVLVWGILGAFLTKAKYFSPFFFTLD